MGKDGAGGSSGGCDGSCACKPMYSNTETTTTQPNNEMHLAVIATLDKQLDRLHRDLNNVVGDDDVTQEQIGIIIQHLIEISESY